VVEKTVSLETPTPPSNAAGFGQSGHVGDQDVSAQIVQPRDALGADDPLAQRTPPRSASKHPDRRSRTGAGVDQADHIAAELERDELPPSHGKTAG